MKDVFIYALNCPITGRTRYIGKTINPSTRIATHVCAAKKERNHRACWIRSLLKEGRRPLLEIIDEVPEEHWQQWEVAYIEFFREQGYDLVNETAGGESPPSCAGRKTSPETRAKQSAGNVGQKRTLTTCENIRASLRGKSPWLGKKHTAASLVKMSLAAIARESRKRLTANARN